MNKADLIDRIAEKTETSKAAAARVFEAIFDASSGAIAEAVQAGKHVSIPGFGKFRSKERAARKGRNPQTGTEIDIPASTVVSFSAAKTFRETVKTRGGSDSGVKAKSAGGRSGGAAKSASKPAAKGAAAKSTPAKSAPAKSAGAARGAAAKTTAERRGARTAAPAKKTASKSAPAKSAAAKSAPTGTAAKAPAKSGGAKSSGGPAKKSTRK